MLQTILDADINAGRTVSGKLGESRALAGGRRGIGTNEERDQTLNQLLTELDGFEGRPGVLLLAATNRPEVSHRDGSGLRLTTQEAGQAPCIPGHIGKDAFITTGGTLHVCYMSCIVGTCS